MSGLANNTSYNPLDSFITFTSVYGGDTMVKFEDLQLVFTKRITEGILFGVKVGAASLTMIVMWMISKRRTSPIFIMNQLSLVFTILHASFYFNYLLDGFGSIVYTLTLFPQLITSSDLHVFATANVVEVLLVSSIEASLVFQVNVMFAGSNHRKFAWLLVGFSLGLALATVALYFVTAVKMIAAAYASQPPTNPIYFNVSLFLLAASVFLMTLMLTVKLILAIRSRRFLGLKQFDSFHILLIMSCQTLIAPSVLYILGFILDPKKGNDYLITLAQLLVVLSLPLSSMWATTANDASSGTSMSSKESVYGSDSLYSKSKCSQFTRTFMNRFSSKPAKNDEICDSAFVAVDSLEKNARQGISGDVCEFPQSDLSDQATSISSHKKEAVVYASTVDEDKRSFSSDINGYTVTNMPLASAASVNRENSLCHVARPYEENEGVVETRKIILKKNVKW
ncbi:STE2 (YFL026W) [Zygosaccharomyces parabailii]|nr:STE2 (YFL026W) [Zygosaccharomyces parabailii]CDH09645.1 related to STE2-Pheromone alpha-factor receptor [Zygosaccharomyces bailii ISA1307]